MCSWPTSTERLLVEFGDRVPVSIINGIVLECRHELPGSPVLALPELVDASLGNASYRPVLIDDRRFPDHYPRPGYDNDPPRRCSCCCPIGEGGDDSEGRVPAVADAAGDCDACDPAGAVLGNG
jgi:hypothetical protein